MRCTAGGTDCTRTSHGSRPLRRTAGGAGCTRTSRGSRPLRRTAGGTGCTRTSRGSRPLRRTAGGADCTRTSRGSHPTCAALPVERVARERLAVLIPHTPYTRWKALSVCPHPSAPPHHAEKGCRCAVERARVPPHRGAAMLVRGQTGKVNILKLSSARWSPGLRLHRYHSIMFYS